MLIGFALLRVKPASYLHLQVNGPLSLKCYIQALEICYIRLCHKAELRTALSTPTPRHPHAPEHQLDASHNSASTRLPPSSTLSSTVSDQHTDKPMEGQSSNPDLTSSLMPEGTGGSCPAEAAAGAPSFAASEADSGEAAAPSDPGSCTEQFGLSQLDYCCMHSPFHKLVRKAFARLTHIDQLRQQNPPAHQATASQNMVSSSNGLCINATAASAGNLLINIRSCHNSNVVLHACCTHHVQASSMRNIIKHAICCAACSIYHSHEAYIPCPLSSLKHTFFC